MDISVTDACPFQFIQMNILYMSQFLFSQWRDMLSVSLFRIFVKKLKTARANLKRAFVSRWFLCCRSCGRSFSFTLSLVNLSFRLELSVNRFSGHLKGKNFAVKFRYARRSIPVHPSFGIMFFTSEMEKITCENNYLVLVRTGAGKQII